MRFLIGLTVCMLLGVAALSRADDARISRTPVLLPAATSRLLIVIGVPEHSYSVQQVRFGVPVNPVYVVGADPISAVVGNIIGHMVASQMTQSDRLVSEQKTKALATFFDAHALDDLIKPSLTGALGELSVSASIKPSEGSKPEVELRKTLVNDPAFDHAVAITPAVQFDDDLLSLKTVYDFSGWRSDAGVWSRKPSRVGQINIFFDYSKLAQTRVPADTGSWNTADVAELKAAFDESGHLLAILLERVMRQSGDIAKRAFVIATTHSLEKVRGYRQDDIGSWSVIVDDNNNYHVLKPKKLFVLRQEG